MKISYVILHYLVEAETIDCARTILAATKESKIKTQVVIVDNGSGNGSLEKIKAEFAKERRVVVLENKQNLGYARGLNVGFDYAKYVLAADFIVLLNNDVLVQQNDINETIEALYEKYQFAVMGPDIVTLDQKHQNPMNTVRWTLGKVRKFRLKKRVEYVLSNFSVCDKWLKINAGAYHKKKIDKIVKNTQLHGAFLVFSPEYIKDFDGLYPGTFLYMEEDILKLQMDYYGKLMLYAPEIEVVHKEDVATNAAKEKPIKKKHAIYGNLLKSSREYLRLYKNYHQDGVILKIFQKLARRAKGADYQVDRSIPDGYLGRYLGRRLMMRIRGMWRMKSKVFVGRRVKISCKTRLVMGRNATIGDNCELDALSKSGIVLGANSSLGAGTVVRCSGNLAEIGSGMRLGEGSSLADNCFVGATGGVWIGDEVIAGQNVRFHSSNHQFERTDVPIKQQGVVAKGIYIGNNCWIGAGAVFCDGVVIGDGCVVGANAVVTKSFPSNAVIAGCPAKIIKMRGEKK